MNTTSRFCGTLNRIAGRSPAHFVEIFRAYYGPTLKTFAALAPAGRVALEQDLLALVASLNRSGDATMVVPAEYLEVVITKR